MQFLFIKSKRELNNNEISKIKKSFNEYNSIFVESVSYEWLSTDKKSYFIGKNPNLEIYNNFKVFNINQNNSISFIHGWLKHAFEDELIDITSFNKNFDDVDGYFNMGIIDDDGTGKIYNSKLCPSIYYTKSSNIIALSNRLFILSDLCSLTKINKKHVASHIQYQSSTITFDTLFENIFQIPFGSKISITDDDLIIERNYNYLFDKKLQDLYNSNKNQYWDDCFNRLQSQAKSIFQLCSKDQIICPITGGKDSRLLLSLYYNYINSTFTVGPVYSPEVIVGRMVCDILEIPHKINNISPTTNFINLMEFMPHHIFEREFEISPWDFGNLRTNITQNITVGGHEFVKIKPYPQNSKEQVENIVMNNFNHNNAIHDYYNEIIKQEVLKHSEKYLNKIDDPSKFSIIKTQLERGRWASKAHETSFNFSFIFFPLLTNTALTYAYNSSNESKNLEEFHYEMIKRSNEKLLNIPFFNDELKSNPLPPIENKIPGKMNYKNIYLLEYFDYIQKYINENFSLISDIVKKEFIDGLTKEKIFNDIYLSQIIYNILQYIIILKTDDLSKLKNKLELNWNVDNIQENVDDLDELTLKALIEYNKDIFSLKKKNNAVAFEKYDTCRIDLKNKGNSTNSLKILRISDEQANCTYPLWFKNDSGEGLQIQSKHHNLDIELECIGNGELDITLRSLDVRKGNGERLPIYINYTKVSINGNIIFNENKLISCDEFYNFKIKVNNKEKIKLHLEWNPF